jgi:tripartite-type tricarboxylate transporter receptor subunit TctC
VLAVGASKRIAQLPDTPTFIESGYPGYEVYVWWGIVAPAGVPRPALERLRREMTEILNDPKTKELLAADAAVVKISTPGEFRTLIHDEVVKWKGVAKTAGIRVE